MSRISQIIATLEAERADLQGRLEWIDQQLEEFRSHQEERDDLPELDADGVLIKPKRAKRIEKASRARKRRAAVKPLKRNLQEDVIAHLAKHPGSTAGDVARALDANRNTIATKLSQLVKTGDLTKAERGYEVARKAQPDAAVSEPAAA